MLSAGWKDGTGLGVPSLGAGALFLGALLSGSGAGSFSANLTSTTGGVTEEGLAGTGLGMPLAGGGALPFGALLSGTGNLTSFGAGGGAEDGSVGRGIGRSVPVVGATSLGFLFWTGPGTFTANLTSTTGGGTPEWSSWSPVGGAVSLAGPKS